MTALGALALVLASADGGASLATLELEVQGVVAGKGTVWVAVHDRADSFPGKHEQAFRRVKLKVDAAPLRARLEGVPFGDYAVSVVYDFDDDGQIKKNFLGAPVEGYGVTNNSTGFAAFSFDAAKFRVDRPLLKQTVVVRR